MFVGFSCKKSSWFSCIITVLLFLWYVILLMLFVICGWRFAQSENINLVSESNMSFLVCFLARKKKRVRLPWQFTAKNIFFYIQGKAVLILRPRIISAFVQFRQSRNYNQYCLRQRIHEHNHHKHQPMGPNNIYSYCCIKLLARRKPTKEPKT